MLMSEFGTRLRRERELAGLSQGQLAKLIDKNKGQSFISNFETGGRVATSWVVEIAHALGVDAYWLKTGKGNRTGGRNLTEDEEALLNALPLLDADVRESWIDLAKKKIGRFEASKQKAGVISLANYRRTNL